MSTGGISCFPSDLHARRKGFCGSSREISNFLLVARDVILDAWMLGASAGTVGRRRFQRQWLAEAAETATRCVRWTCVRSGASMSPHLSVYAYAEQRWPLGGLHYPVAGCTSELTIPSRYVLLPGVLSPRAVPGRSPGNSAQGQRQCCSRVRVSGVSDGLLPQGEQRRACRVPRSK